ncbi:MAG: TIGR03915 family putative DNA repair protein [Bacteroidetes bacterium]|nr:TIGR03915 family putative DNA repair protein [Bacteroidota bacterium]
MTTLVYDNTLPGFLTTIFEVYEYRIADADIVPVRRAQSNLFGSNKYVETDESKASRVWKGIKKHAGGSVTTDIYRSFLSELPGMENMLLQYIGYILSKGDVSRDFSHPAVLYITETVKKVRREKHRMEAFVRFRQTADDLYYATVEPDYNVLPLIADHFEKRYADQRWLIYDMRRNYGIYYDLHTVATVEVDFKHILSGYGNADGILNEKEKEYERLWQNYFKSVNIASRKNLKLHRQHMPLRYWKYLTEKK